MEIAALAALAAAGIWGFPFAGFGIAAIGIALSVPAGDAFHFAELLESFRCSDACDNARGWESTTDAWQWTALWIAASAGRITLWLSVALAFAAGAMGFLLRARAAARWVHLAAAVGMAITLACWGAFTFLVAGFGDRYGI